MQKTTDSFSAVILAGGKSLRMGKNKSELELCGMSFAEYQVQKLRRLGFRDIMLSGYDKPVDGARNVPDIFLRQGPLGGIYAGLCAAENENCFFISVDTPLCPEDAIRALLSTHTQSGNPITVLVHADRLEPLIGVYSRSLCPLAEDILKTNRTSVMRLFDAGAYTLCPYNGDISLIESCNTPEEYKKLIATFANLPHDCV